MLRLQLSSGVLIGYRSLPQLEQSFDVPSHLAYLDAWQMSVVLVNPHRWEMVEGQIDEVPKGH